MRRLLLPLCACILFLGLSPIAVLASPAQSGSGPAQYLCLLVLDGGKPEYITNNLKQMPNMRALLKHSRWYNQAWVGSLMSITPPDHAVIGTGSFPKDDGGIVNWDWGIYKTGHISPTFQSVTNYQNNYAFKLIKDSGTPTLSGVIKKKYPKGLVIAGSGVHFHAAGPMGGPDASWIFSYTFGGHHNWAPYQLGPKKVPAKLLNDPSLRTSLPTSNGSSVPLTYDPLKIGVQDSYVVKFGIKTLQEYRPRAMMLNLPEVDTIGHWSQHWKTDESIIYRSFDKDLGKLIAAYKAAGIYSKTLFVVTADHGMIQSQHRVLDHEAVISQIKSTLGHKSIILTNGGGSAGPTMTSIWLKDPTNDEKMAKAIFAKNYDNVSAIYYLDTSNGQYRYHMAGCNGCSPGLEKTYDYLMSTDAGPTGESIAILLRENARNSGLPQMLGRHGGADWGSQHVTMIFSGPGVKDGTSNAPARLTDLAPTIERLMGMTPQARDGIVLADAFQTPNAADTAKQQQADALYTPMVQALSQRAASDIKLEAEGKLPNFIPSDEIIIHWKRRLAVTAACALVLIGTAIGAWWAISGVRKGTGLNWTA